MLSKTRTEHFTLTMVVLFLLLPPMLSSQVKQRNIAVVIDPKNVTARITQPSLAELAQTRLTRTLTVERGSAKVEYALDDIDQIDVTKPKQDSDACKLKITQGGNVVEGDLITEATRIWIVGKTSDGGAFRIILCNAEQITLKY